MPSRPSRPAAIVQVLALGILAGLAARSVRAETDPSGSTSRFLIEEQQRLQTFGRRSAEAPPIRRAPRPSAAAPPRASRPPATLSPPRKAPALVVAVYGDRLAQALARGLDEDAGDWLSVAILAGEDAGLTRSDFDAWVGSVRARLQRPDRPAVAVVMLGSNDRRPLPDGQATAAPASPRWQSVYAARVDALASAFHDAHVPLVWVGLPTVHGDATSADFVRLNVMFRDRAGRDDTAYVDSWAAFSDETGNYSPIGPDVEGRTVKLRKADGFGFTRAGGRKLASFVEQEIKRLRTLQPAPEGPPQVADITIEKASDFDQALEIDVNAQVQRAAGLVPGGGPAVSKPPTLPARPATGPVVSLTAAPLSPDGALATASPAPLQAALVVKDAGAWPGAARPGRADDFSWPKP